MPHRDPVGRHAEGRAQLPRRALGLIPARRRLHRREPGRHVHLVHTYATWEGEAARVAVSALRGHGLEIAFPGEQIRYRDLVLSSLKQHMV